MAISREEAVSALEGIAAAGARVNTVRRYAEFAPYLLAWGTIWLVANVVSDVRPQYGDAAWLGGLVLGGAFTIALTVRNARRWTARNPGSTAEGRAIGRRVAMLGTTLWLYFPAMVLLMGPLTPRQSNAFISLSWALIYMVAGTFIGWRIFAIGVVTAAAVLLGYLFLPSHFFLWMGLVGGGSLIVGGLWLRKI